MCDDITIKYNGMRVLMQNVNTYNVSEKKNGYLVNEKRLKKYSIFFNHDNGTTYTELISFDTELHADIVCDIIDVMRDDYVLSKVGDEFYLVIDWTAGTWVVQEENERHDDRIYIPENKVGRIIDLNEIIAILGLEKNVVKA